jgi:cytochrome b
MSTEPMQKIRVWDLPTRVFHWALAALYVALVATGWTGGEVMPWHARAGYGVATLLLFRVAWGFIGGHWSRFGTFVFGPDSVRAYLRGQGEPLHSIGHNPLGALSVFALLLFLLLQVATGLFSEDKADFAGPLNALVSSAAAKAATWYHQRVGQWIVLALVLLHIGAILDYLLRKKLNLLRPMVDGNKAVGIAAPASRDTAGTRLLALAVLAVCAAAVACLVSLGA